MLKVCILYLFYGAIFKTKNNRVRKSQDDRGVSGNDELRIFRDHLFDRRNKSQLTVGRKRSFRLIKQVQAFRHKTRLKQLHETFAV